MPASYKLMKYTWDNVHVFTYRTFVLQVAVPGGAETEAYIANQMDNLDENINTDDPKEAALALINIATSITSSSMFCQSFNFEK